MYVSQILQKSLEKMNAGRVKFRFILCDALEIEAHLPAIITYDRIIPLPTYGITYPFPCY